MDKLTAHNPTIAFESFTNALPSPAAPLPKQGEGNVIKPDLELFHKASTPDRTPTQAQEDAAAQYEMGLAEGTRKAADLHASTIAVMQESLTNLQQSFAAQLDLLKIQNAEMVTRIFETVLPALAQQSFKVEFENILTKLIDADIASTVHITCAESDVNDLKELISNCAKPELFKLRTAPLAAQQIEMNWENGGGVIDYSHAIDAANALINTQFKPQ
jgi:hypothetical protein